MADFDAIDFLKRRLAEAQQAFEEEKARYALATAAWQKANNLVQACQRLIEEEQRRTQHGSIISHIPDGETLTIASMTMTHPEANKTDLVRDTLRQQAGGTTPKDLWRALQGQIKHRPYLYSILKRLKDKDEVAVRRGKYFLLQRPEQEELLPPISQQDSTH